MNKTELCEIVYKICEACGYDFLFVLDDCASAKVSSESADILRRLTVLYEKEVNVE